jgi:hypothetical protein
MGRDEDGPYLGSLELNGIGLHRVRLRDFPKVAGDSHPDSMNTVPMGDSFSLPKEILLAKCSRSKSSKAGGTGSTEGNLIEPSEQAGHIDSGSDEDML